LFRHERTRIGRIESEVGPRIGARLHGIALIAQPFTDSWREQPLHRQPNTNVGLTFTGTSAMLARRAVPAATKLLCMADQSRQPDKGCRWPPDHMLYYRSRARIPPDARTQFQNCCAYLRFYERLSFPETRRKNPWHLCRLIVLGEICPGCKRRKSTIQAAATLHMLASRQNINRSPMLQDAGTAQCADSCGQ
jgi:hypothetical protein